MPRFILAYIPSDIPPPSAEEGAENQQRYKEWLAALGDAIIEPANPFGSSRNVAKDGISDSKILSHMMGYTLVEAIDINAAMEMAASCPFLEMGSIDVAPLMSM